ncbi:MAG: type IV pili methyl-accepting chemotaxis transducer N-terminal domain-containing protein [Azoarcus sp.]|nr:type IV pili methyl-accepting chemotaxis transducer N-terminal domain-containing protein [Azoarcus sp.]MDX9837202.1 type IV pili methyl-accepting chemotaxis transducer N-terminal domain-containing protein [Azoarcus sp.]
MFHAKRILAVKITTMLMVFFLVALTAIGLTLFISWQLEGASAAVNDAGSLRMRTYRIAHQLSNPPEGEAARARFTAKLQREIDEIDFILNNLVHGDPTRPLFIPRDAGIPDDVDALANLWRQRIRPLLDAFVTPGTITREHGNGFGPVAEDFVDRINRTVLKMEKSYGHSIDVLRISQILLVVLAIIGTIVLLRFFFNLVIQPVSTLGDALHRISEEDFTIRVPVRTKDELGKLAEGFNTMAGHLENLYTTLEERVDEKTRTLTSKNKELEILYTIGAFLRAPTDVDSLCSGFLDRVQVALSAKAGSVRLLDASAENLCITAAAGLDTNFRNREALLPCGKCLCGEATTHKVALVADITENNPKLTLDNCRLAGFRGVAVTSISVGKKPIGVFNLFFERTDTVGESERKLLETLGEQLGSAIDNLRLRARDRELAVSDERNLLAHELHDSIAQGLAFLNIQLQLLEKSLDREDDAQMRSTLKLIRRGVDESYDDVRELLVHFRARIEPRDLDGAIRAALRHVAEQTGIGTEFEADGGGAPLDPETETQVLYIVQEALSNIRKHARAKTVKISLRRGFEGLSVTVRDDGVGFKQETAPRTGNDAHIGLDIMQERAARIGGRISVRSSRGKGTEIRFDLPRQTTEVA